MEPTAVSFNSFNGRRGDLFGHPHRLYPRKQSQQHPSDELSQSTMDAPCVGKMGSVSNLHQFLQHTTPRVLSQSLSKTRLRGLSSEGSKECCFFLNDLWHSFDEWSAYGAGVPIVLNSNETVMQYYVPYLSAIQLYTSAESDLTDNSSRRLGDDSDGSEMDYRDSNSDTSGSDGEAERLSSAAAWSSLDNRGSRKRGEFLLFEFFEALAPSQRVPLFDKVRELAGSFPGIKTLCSNEISNSSWLSVAWYPIYRIPMGPTLKDLTACFLTYHSLSTLVTAGDPSHITRPHTLCGTQMVLHPFGFTGYKFRGPVWSPLGAKDRQYTSLLQKLSHDWLKRLHVQHPDFDYFVSHFSSNFH